MPKILIADDELHIRLLLEQTLEELEEEGVEIILASDGEMAYNLIVEEEPELILLDIMMPKMSGFEVCSKVRSELNKFQGFIILLTAKGQEFDKEMGREVGANLYLTKPFDPDEILRKAKEVLRL